jgi:FtsH-binding integral membrane protein
MMTIADTHRGKTGAPFYGVLVAATVLTMIAHEIGHWAMGTALGYSMAMSLNEAYALVPGTVSARDKLLIDAAGPAITILQALIAYLLIRQRGLRLAYPFLFAAWFMRFAAAFVSVFLPNDEARLSIALFGGMWWLPAVVVLGLFALLWSAARRLGIGWKTNFGCYLVSSLMIAAIVFGDRML